MLLQNRSEMGRNGAILENRDSSTLEALRASSHRLDLASSTGKHTTRPFNGVLQNASLQRSTILQRCAELLHSASVLKLSHCRTAPDDAKQQ